MALIIASTLQSVSVEWGNPLLCSFIKKHQNKSRLSDLQEKLYHKISFEQTRIMFIYSGWQKRSKRQRKATGKHYMTARAGHGLPQKVHSKQVVWSRVDSYHQRHHELLLQAVCLLEMYTPHTPGVQHFQSPDIRGQSMVGKLLPGSPSLQRSPKCCSCSHSRCKTNPITSYHIQILHGYPKVEFGPRAASEHNCIILSS